MSERSAAFTALFVRRPVLALVINALIVVAGLAAFNGIEIRELPNIDRPIVTITTTYDGAAPETIDTEVTSVIEGAVARVAGVASISSSSQSGRSRVTAEFGDNVDIETAANDLRGAVDRVRNTLPDDADDPQVVKSDADSDPIMRVAILSDTMSIENLTTLVDDRITDRLSAVDGVADVQAYGDREAIFRVDVDEAALAARGLTLADLVTTLSSVTFDAPAGSLRTGDQALIVRADARVITAEAMGDLLVDASTRVRDIAYVSRGPDINSTQLRVNGRVGIGLGIIRASGSNTIDISNNVRQAVADLQATMPKGVEIRVTSDDATFINGALHEVEIALGLGIAVVVLVIYLFLADARATLIPAVTIPVSLIGTLAAIWLVGFSINILTLLALVLATGIVVDDAIVVLENIVRQRHLGLKSRAAAVVGTQEVFFAVLATTATLAAVFVPISFLPGQAGGLFREFGFVLAMAVAISSITALTFAPMLAAYVLPESSSGHGEGNLLGRALNAVGAVLARIYFAILRAALALPLVVIVLCLLFGAVAYVSFKALPQELTPSEDRGVILMRVSAPQGVSIDYMSRQMDQINAILKPYRDSGEAQAVLTIAGRGTQLNSGFVVMTLADWAERERGQQAIAREINAKLAKLPGMRAFAFSPNSLGIRGGGQGLRVGILGPTYEGLQEEAGKMIAAMNANPAFDGPRLDTDPTQPQLSIDINRERVKDLGISLDDLQIALQAVLDGRKIAEVNVAGDAVPVKLMSTANPVNDPKDLENLFLRSGDGRMVPMSSVATIRENASAPELDREEQTRAVTITSNLGNGVAMQGALDTARQIAATTLAPGYRLIPLGEAATLEETSSGLSKTFGFAIAIVLLVLAAQFESFVSALIIIATVPFGLAAAVFAILLTGGTINLYSQIGLVMLVGIMAKNGILVVEFANQLRDQGMSVREAIEEACRVRLRPVMMTMIATIVGAVPLVLAFGAGAEARVALGWVLVGGLGFATVFTLFLTPVMFLLLARFSKPRATGEQRLASELAEAATLSSKPPREPEPPAAGLAT
ncbi:Efflux pump membrane transporter BepE [Hartmannibacter diazotrophicus]|uniref:Efflux pump membrane transporter BepE n=1 Tax=Hartmannibacter diazotrophicus TaxID=1482074 RepID=A0A2C9D2F4_9HYPH|nr:efflux RND transporter permease subunit [Hartmannibacter diazotrophicus]SON54440.1 Efflux pump membrane transporter BepE [Hartmannibacter diazotrophicus]